MGGDTAVAKGGAPKAKRTVEPESRKMEEIFFCYARVYSGTVTIGYEEICPESDTTG